MCFIGDHKAASVSLTTISTASFLQPPQVLLLEILGCKNLNTGVLSLFWANTIGARTPLVYNSPPPFYALLNRSPPPPLGQDNEWHRTAQDKHQLFRGLVGAGICCVA